MQVTPIPGQEHLPWAEVHLDAIDEGSWREASAAARALGKDGLEVWTHDDSTAVLRFLGERAYVEARRYLLQQLDVLGAPDCGEPAYTVVTLAERPELARALYEIAREAYPDQPTREDSTIGDFDRWRVFGLDPHPPDAYFVALDGAGPVGYGYLEIERDTATHGFLGVARAARGRGVATAIKQAQIRWARAHGILTLKTATETRISSMRTLNARLGYRVVRSEIVLRGPLAPLD